MTPKRWQQIESLYHAALDLEQNERDAFLATACAGDDELRNEVESLLRDKPDEDNIRTAGWVQMASPAGNPSTLIGHEIESYKILSLLGVGGMGEVYRAKDLKLRREVAIKVLPASLSNDRDRLRRLEREARLLAALNHPHIAAIYGFEQSHGTAALILELVEGPTLAERLASGSLPIVEALTVALQVAEALAAAHEKGIIHRDLKPANVKITPNGSVKVLDFGLAQALVADGTGRDLSALPTLTVESMREGVIAGTPAYMSPEQARGNTVDRRTDIWSFGCLLYELLVGQSPFREQTVSDTIARVLSQEPDWQAVPAALPQRGLELLQRCLVKDQNRRRRDIADVRIELEQVLRTLEIQTDSVAAVAPAPQKTWRRKLLWPAAGLAIAAGASAMIWYMRTEAPVQVMRLNMDVKPADALAGLT
jgi:eukaryotic-like serine/threonine-protein kinase